MVLREIEQFCRLAPVYLKQVVLWLLEVTALGQPKSIYGRVRWTWGEVGSFHKIKTREVR